MFIIFSQSTWQCQEVPIGTKFDEKKSFVIHNLCQYCFMQCTAFSYCTILRTQLPCSAKTKFPFFKTDAFYVKFTGETWWKRELIKLNNNSLFSYSFSRKIAQIGKLPSLLFCYKVKPPIRNTLKQNKPLIWNTFAA